MALVDGVLGATDGIASVVRLAPALDAVLVVLELIHRVGPEGVLVLVPSSARAGQLAARLRRSGLEVALMPDGWERAASGQRVVVGTRAAAWAPLPGLRAAVVLDAHDEAYREERSPTWSAVDVVVERGRRDRVPVALVTPCPPVALAEGRPVVTTSRPVERRGWPVVEVVDRTADDPRTGLFSERLARLLHSVLDRPEGRVVCILNRTGRARLLACAHCGALARCTRCGGAMAQDQSGDGLRCRRCDEPRPTVCAECDATRLKTLRIGVTRATEELSALTGVEAREITGTSDPSDRTGLSEARLVVGTEAALHRVPRADVVAFLDIDQHLLAARFGAARRRWRSWPGRPGWSVPATPAAGCWSRPGSPTTRCSGPRCTAIRPSWPSPNGPCAGRWASRPSGRWPCSAGRAARPMPHDLASVAGITVSSDARPLGGPGTRPPHAVRRPGLGGPARRAPAGGGRPRRRLRSARRPCVRSGGTRTLGTCPRTRSGSTATRC